LDCCCIGSGCGCGGISSLISASCAAPACDSAHRMHAACLTPGDDARPGYAGCIVALLPAPRPSFVLLSSLCAGGRLIGVKYTPPPPCAINGEGGMDDEPPPPPPRCPRWAERTGVLWGCGCAEREKPPRPGEGGMEDPDTPAREGVSNSSVPEGEAMALALALALEARLCGLRLQLRLLLGLGLRLALDDALEHELLLDDPEERELLRDDDRPGYLRA